MSKNFEKVKQFYITKSWPLNWVQDTMNYCITAAEPQETVGKKLRKC